MEVEVILQGYRKKAIAVAFRFMKFYKAGQGLFVYIK
jgi:hypothetical protein